MQNEKNAVRLHLLRAVYATLIVLVIAGTPLVMTPETYDSFVLPKIVWVKVTVLLALFTAALRVTFGERFRIYLHEINLLLLVFMGIICLSIIAAKSTSLALENLSFLATVILFAFLLQDYVREKRSRIVLIGWILIVISSVTALWVIYEDFIRAFRPEWMRAVSRLSDWRGYLTAGLGNTNHVADFIAFCLLITLAFYIYVRGKLREAFTLVSLWLSFAGLLICWSVGSNAGLLIGAVVLIYLLARAESMRFWRRKALRLLLLLAGWCLITAFYWTDQPLNPHRPSLLKQAYSSERWHAGLPTRLAIWANTLELIRLHPWLGVGIGNFTYQYVAVSSPMLLASPDLAPYAGLYTNAAHNEVLQIWAELGVFGLAAFIALIVLFYKAMLQKMQGSSKTNYLIRAAGIACMTAFLAQSMMNFTLRLPASTVLFFSLVSLPVVLTDKTRALVATSQLVPLELRYRYASLTVYLERLRYPRQLDIQLRITKWLRIVLAGVLVIAALIGVGRITRTWESDRHYKIARNLVDAGDLKAAETEFNIALKLNQEHSDARSAYGAFLLRQGRYREGLEQLLQVNKRLDSLEIHERLAEAYGILGEPKKELEQWRIFFSRRPQNRFAHPAEYDRYLKLLRQ